METETARKHMIEQQVRPWDVSDENALEILSAIPREEFVPGNFRDLAFADTGIPLPHGETMMRPAVEGRLLQALAPGRDHRVLEIGTGSGFLTAYLATRAGRVTSIDIHEDFTEQARTRIARLRLHNVHLEAADFTDWEPTEKFDCIAVNGSLPMLDERLSNWLCRNGRLFVITGSAPVMEANLITRTGDAEWSKRFLFETVLPPLRGVAQPESFRF